MALLSAPLVSPSVHAQPEAAAAYAQCLAFAQAPTASVAAGRPYLAVAYQALERDRAQLAGLGPQRHSAILSAVAEQHSAYMASIGTWSDGDPAGGILARVRAAGLNATYAGQNVVTADGDTVAGAIAQGEAFFAQEAAAGGPHWDNITNPNHTFAGVGLAVLGASGSYTIYLTQVFSDAGTCGGGTTAAASFAQAGETTPALHVGDVVHPSVDALQLRTEPRGMVLQTLHAGDRLKVMDLQDGWAQVKVLSTSTFGWAFASFLTAM